MRRVLSSFLAFLLPAAAIAAEPALLQKVAGTVEMKAAPDAPWSQAQPGAKLASGGQLRTGPDGRAELKFKNKSSVWLKPSTSVALDQKGPKHNQIVLTAGSLKIRVPHLAFREKFEVKSPMAVASVRGTVFTIDDKKVQTLFGQVDMHLNNGRTVPVPQGTGLGEDGKVVSLSKLEQDLGMQDWSPGLSDQERQKELVSFVENRQQIRDYAHDALARNSELVDSLAANVKQDDFAAGRTLTDVHGNLVRVEQRLDRPDDHTIEVVNITLRQNYSGANLRNFTYHGPTTSRVDALVAKAEFNQSLPTQINEFPGFFSSHDDVKVDHASLVLANMEDPTQIATLAFLGDRASLSGGTGDDIQSDLYVGDLNGPDARKKMFQLDSANALAAGLSRYHDAGTDSINDKGVNGELYGAGAKRFRLVAPGSGGPTAGYVWVGTESFVINNGGAVRNVSDYTSAGANVQDLLGDSAAESVVFVKNEGALSAPPSTLAQVNALSDTFSSGRNIDLVVIPDLFVSVVKSLATSGDALKTTY